MNNYRSKIFGDKVFLTTDHGSFCVLSIDEFRKLKANSVGSDEGLKKKLFEREILLDEDNVGEAVSLMRKKYSYLFYGPALHIVVITLRCNMACVYCHASSVEQGSAGYDMDKETAKKTVDFIFQTKNNCVTIEFQGGEPLLNWDILKFITEYAKEKNKTEKKNLKLSVVTNMTVMDDDKMDYLINNEIDICTSLDGPKKLHDHNRKYKSSNYEDVVFWVKKINAEYRKRNIDRQVNALVTLTRESLKYPKEIVDEYLSLGMKSVHLRYLNNLGVASKTWDHISYSPEEYLEFWKTAVSYIEEKRKSGVKIYERMIKIMFDKIFDDYDPGYLDLRSPCGAAIGQLAYNYDGKVYTCDEARMIGSDLFLLGNVKDTSLKEAVCCDTACATVSASINDQYICDGCVYKPYCGICPVCNYAEQGSVVGKISQTARCKIYKVQFDWVVENLVIPNETQN